MDQIISELNSANLSKKSSNISDFLEAVQHEKTVSILWEPKDSEYDSGPKLGID
ncbi:MAG: hypothetical protein HY200_03120 [Nitrospirae bacterium]|nr:hypothetical protein [Nitrospirota bacterium]MBI3593924.1 hypothetical protein [Nitrospirota bacterium]